MGKRIINRFNYPVSGYIHFIAAALAVAGTVLLIIEASSPPKPYYIVSSCVFGVGMILLFTASGLYHTIAVSSKWMFRLQKFDHMMIFFLIASSYMPICLVPLRGGWGWSFFGVSWALALGGMIFKLFWFHAPRWISTLIYLFAGWLILIGIYPLVTTLSAGALSWLVAGGVFYSAGAVVYSLKKPNLVRFYFTSHELWHVFVILGAASCYVVMYEYLGVYD